MTVKNISTSIILAVLFLLQAGCQPQVKPQTPPLPSSPTYPPEATTTREPTQSPTQTPLEPTHTAQATVTPTEELAPAFQICSPLAIYPLQELPEIISDPYRPPPPGKDARHQGVDFSHYRRGDLLTIEGVEVQSVLPGTVAVSLVDSWPYGNLLILETPAEWLPTDLKNRLGMTEGESLYLLYAHLLEPPQFSLGDSVNACQYLDKVGKSGNAVEAHLHFETRIGPGGVVFPEMRYYRTDASDAARAAYLRWRTSGDFRHFDPMELLLGTNP
jgi:murein DD-endopeptidase MepM/ murein hydrolase activator NlpD